MKWLGCILLYLLVHLQDFVLVSSRRHHRSRERSKQLVPFYSSTGSSGIRHSHPKRAACAVKLPDKCTCSKNSGSLSITCYEADLTEIPQLDVGPSLMTTLNLGKNHLSTIKIGSFFGAKIERLLLANNSISTLDFLSFWGLEFHLEILDLSYNSFKQVPSSSIRLLRNLSYLNLKGNKITSLRDFDFGYLRTLKTLVLEYNPIATIALHTFDGTALSLLILNSINLQNGLGSFPSGNLKFLKEISLANNGLMQFPVEWFSNLKSLQRLSLDDNKLSRLPLEPFIAVADTLETLELNFNRFGRIPIHLIKSLPNLKTLEIRHNRIRKIYPHSFNTSLNLQVLDLSNNKIEKISTEGFEGLDSIQRIDLRHNDLITLDDRTLYWEDPKGRQIFLANNPFLCNCLLQWIKREYKRKTELAGMFVDALDMTCERPHFISGKPLVRVHLKDFTCDHDYYYYYVVEEVEEEDMFEEYDEQAYDYYYDQYDD